MNYVMISYAGEGVILDRSAYSDSVFANVGRSEGYISEEGTVVYRCIVKYIFYCHSIQRHKCTKVTPYIVFCFTINYDSM